MYTFAPLGLQFLARTLFQTAKITLLCQLHAIMLVTHNAIYFKLYFLLLTSCVLIIRFVVLN